ncbi:hypothetical protein [Acidianus brierleyi]|uniref:Uncharacterized protein n=1 Tax=Acidianus brierleyi TaxID=41673 RepID=A0A2U9IFJ6_9CREN|nr:hypothetical protein [Acidianus brierleyi]AWR94766.1 hypothetical protein DFR85_09315 [Acidianus brierleyi]
MKIEEILKDFLAKEEREIEVKDQIEGEFNEEIPLGTKVVINYNGRRRIVDLGFLYIISKCNKNFVKDYLDMSFSLRYIHRKYKVYTEIEYAALFCMEFINDPDIRAALEKLKTYILSRENMEHGL